MTIDSAIRNYGASRQPVWHGTDEAAKKAAIARARKIDGYVILSKGPDAGEATGFQDKAGYWSDPSGFCRNWETLVWPR
jgi:lipopolysaccharide biosynthesis regulator YciM